LEYINYPQEKKELSKIPEPSNVLPVILLKYIAE
jgi:hypothetical protein